MALPNEHKLKNLLQLWPNGTVATALWLESLDISKQLRLSYKKHKWLELLSAGAFIRPGDRPQWQGGLYAIQEQARLNIHPGGLTALTFQGFAHYLRPGNEIVYLFAKPRITLPGWFKKHDWGKPIEFYRSLFLPEGLGLVEHKEATFNIEISTPEGKFKSLNASIISSLGLTTSIILLCTLISNCSLAFLWTNVDLFTVYFKISVGNGTGPITSTP